MKYRALTSFVTSSNCFFTNIGFGSSRIPDCGTNYTQTIACIGKEALQAVVSGAITPDDAGSVASLIGANARLIALTELNQRMNAFEK